MGSRNQVLDGGSRSDEFVCSLKQGVKLRQCTLYYVIFMLNYFGHFFVHLLLCLGIMQEIDAKFM